MNGARLEAIDGSLAGAAEKLATERDPAVWRLENRASSFDRRHRRNEPIASPRQSLDKPWIFSIVVECVAQLLGRGVETVIEVDQGAGRPQAFAQGVTRYDLSRVLQEHRQHLKWLLLQLQLEAIAAQLARFKVNVEGSEMFAHRWQLRLASTFGQTSYQDAVKALHPFPIKASRSTTCPYTHSSPKDQHWCIEARGFERHVARRVTGSTAAEKHDEEASFQNQSADHAARRSFMGSKRRREGQARRYGARDTAGRRDPRMERGDARRDPRQHARQSADHSHGSDRNSAMFDAQNGVGRQRYRPIFVTERAPHGTHRRAALVQAAYVTLKSFYPEQLSRFDAQRALSLAEFHGEDSAEVQRGIEWGEFVANQILAWRATDGFSDPVPPFTGAGAIIGQWESATGTSMSAGNISFTAPFVLTSNTQFQSAFPRPWTTLVSPEYAADFNEVTTIGAKAGSSRTLDQTHVAFFFNGYATNDYIEAAIQIARKHRTSRSDNARIFALLTIAMHDTSVTIFRAKRDFGTNPADLTWRPILAIPKAHLDNNPETAPIADWAPLITTPNHPEYPASHPGSHGAGPRVLQHFFGDRNTFELHPAFNTVFPGPAEGKVQAAALLTHFGHGAGRYRRAHLRRHAFPRLEQGVGKGGRPNRRLRPSARCAAHPVRSMTTLQLPRAKYAGAHGPPAISPEVRALALFVESISAMTPH